MYSWIIEKHFHGRYTIQIPRIETFMYNVFPDFTRSPLNIIFLCWHHEYTSVLLPAALHHEGCDRDQKVPNACSSEPVRRYGVHYFWKLTSTSHIWLDPSLGKTSAIQILYPIVSKYNCVCHNYINDIESIIY